MFDTVTGPDGMAVTNEFDCPLLTLTNIFIAVPSTSILSPASVMHECTSTCVFRKQAAQCRMEQETVDVDNHLQFVHDKNNTIYALNIYCKKYYNL